MIKENLDKFGTGSSIFAALCCIGTPAILAFLASIGLGFLINDIILLPFLFLSLILTGYGLAASKHRHGRKEPLTLFSVSAAVIVITVWFSAVGVIIGLVGLVASTIMNIVYQRRCVA
ncbi:MAG: MerC domain-containing protein [Nitrospinota bacterium]